MHRRIGVLAAACAAVGSLVALPASAAAATKTVYPGGPAAWQNALQKKYGAGVDGFMINRITVNAGDTVVWNGKARFSGFHTVDFPAKGQRDLGLLVPGATVTGVNDAAGNPFWFDGKVPSLAFNPGLNPGPTGGTYDGSKRIESGLPVTPKPVDFKLKFTKAGVYKYFCDVHPGMFGFVVVKPKGQKIPSAKDDATTLAREQATYVTEAKATGKTKPTGNNVSVGASAPGGLEVFAMFPAKLTVKSGTTVKFAMSKLSREAHTASFGPRSYLKPLADSFSGPAPSQTALYSSDPPGTVTLNPTTHGNGFASTGAMDQDNATPLPASGTIKFTAPGTYQYVCLIHPFMHGTVVVTP